MSSREDPVHYQSPSRPSADEHAISVAQRRGRGLRATFRNRDFRWYAVGGFAYSTAIYIQRVAQMLLVLHVTGGSASAVGLVTMCVFVPMLVLGPVGGAIADRANRLLVMRVTGASVTIVAACLGVATLAGWATVPLIATATAVSSGLSAIEAPSRALFLSDLVGRDRMLEAVAANTAVTNTARLVGPAAAGALVAGVGAGWALLLNAGTFLVPLVTLTVLARGHHLVTGRGSSDGRSGRDTGASGSWVQVRAAFRDNPALPAILVISALVAGTAFNLSSLDVVMVTGVFGGDASDFGLVSSATAIGALTGAGVAARRHRPRVRMVAGAALMLAVTITGISQSPSYAVYLLGAVFVGLFYSLFLTSAMTFAQLEAPEPVRGRVVSLVSSAMLATAAVAAPTIGAVADAHGARLTLLLAGGSAAASVGLAAAWFLLRDLLRRRSAATACRCGDARKCRGSLRRPLLLPLSERSLCSQTVDNARAAPATA